MHGEYLLIGIIGAGYVVGTVMLFFICALIKEIVKNLAVKWERDMYNHLGNPSKIVPLETDDFNEFAEVALKYGDILSYEQADSKCDRIIKYINVERLDSQIDKK